MQKVVNVEGMMCQRCVAHVTKALEGIDGVSNVAVSLDAGTATFDAADGVTDDQVKAAIEYRPHAREDARGCRAVAFVILTHGAGRPGGMAATMRAAGWSGQGSPET